MAFRKRMEAMTSMDLLEHLSVIRDPRIDRNKKHDLSAMLLVAVCAAISGAEGGSDSVEFAQAKVTNGMDSFSL